MAATFRSAVLPYKSSFIPSELSTVKLKKNFTCGSSKDKKCPVFNGEHGIEAQRIKDTSEIKPNSECSIHGGRTWSKCVDKPSGDSFKP
jgi:hypothetical protein